MTGASIIGLVIYALVAAVMMGIGIAQLRSKMPVAFYSGEESPSEENLTDVKAWNRKHGWMWFSYGIILLISYFLGMFMGDSVWSVLPMVGGAIVPIIFMIIYHHRLIKKYYKK